jgi:acetone carboxylase gamma subunit
MRSTSEERNAARTPRVLLRSVEAVVRDVARKRRLDRGRPTRTWWTDERERVLSQVMIEPVRIALEVEVAPPDYPLLHEFLPDITGFYRAWLGREVPR